MTNSNKLCANYRGPLPNSLATFNGHTQKPSVAVFPADTKTGQGKQHSFEEMS